MSSYKFTLEDWKNGQIPRPNTSEGNPVKDPLVYLTYESNTPRISEEEFKKIRALQKQVFFELIDLKVDALIRKFRSDIIWVDNNETKEIFHLEFQSLQKKLDDPHLLKRMKLKKWDRSIVTPEIYETYRKYESTCQEIEARKKLISKSEMHGGIFSSTDMMMKRAAIDTCFRKFSEIELKGLFGAYVYFRYYTRLKNEYFSAFENDSELPTIIDSVVEENHIKYGSKEFNIDKLKQILNSGDSITEGKINFISHIQDKFDFRTEKMAFEKASEIYNNIHDGHKKLYKDLSSYQSTKSQFLKKKLNNGN